MGLAKAATASLLALSVAACSTPHMRGPAMPVRLAHVDGAIGTPNGTCDSSGNFTPDAPGKGSAQLNNLELNFSRLVCRSLADSGNATKAADMLQGGATLVKVRCNDYFAAKGTSQEKARLTRSLIAPVSALFTSVFAVVNFSSEKRESDYLALLAAGSTFANAGLKIYEEQFLFNADNINSVRGLTMRALDTHRAAILAASPLTFDTAIRQLTDHEMICTPASILDLTRSAIDTGTVKARKPDGTGPDGQPSPAPKDAIMVDVATS